MANKQINELATAPQALDDTDVVAIEQDVSSVWTTGKITLLALYTWIVSKLNTAGRLIPAGGATGQALAKTSATDYAVSWQSVQSPLPTTAIAGYVLTQQSATPGDFDWSAAPVGLPTGGAAGQVLTKDSGTDYDVSWATPDAAPEPARRRVATMSTPGSATLVHAGLSSVGEGTAGAVSPTNTTPPVTAVVRMSFATAASAGASAGFRYTVAYLYRGADTSSGGFKWRCVWSPQDAATVAQRRCFVGMIAATGAFGNVDPSSKTDLFGVGADSGDPDLSIIHNDSTGTATKIALTGFDQDDAAALYDALLWCDAGDSALRYKVVRHKAGAAPDVIEGSVSSEIPAADTLLTHYVWVNNGSTALAATVHFAFLEVERDV